MAIKILSVNISEKKGTIKKPVDRIILNEKGVDKDAHAGAWHRQVSLLAAESIEKFARQSGRKIEYGEFAENITTEGIVLHEMRPLDHIKIGDIDLEVTQIGKECHGSNCAIFREVGNCVMPMEGIFARVIKGGEVKAGMEGFYEPYTFRAHVITLSDRASKGEYEDRSGPKLIERLGKFAEEENIRLETEHTIIADDADALALLLERARQQKTDFVFTTGGTGIGARDITPDVVSAMLNKEIPGIMEQIRTKYGASKPAALLSRAVAGVMDQSLVFTLPGSVRAVKEYMDEIVPILWHSVLMLHGIDAH
ncbi:MAG: hypothetical protein Kow00127_22230 [Bacteroidales bacterium]